MKRIITLMIAAAALVLPAQAQTAEIKITFNEQFFDAFLEAVFTHLDEPKVPLTSMLERRPDGEAVAVVESGFPRGPRLGDFFPSFVPASGLLPFSDNSVCDEAVKLKRVVDGVHTAVRFRQGKIYAPIAFTGNYNPPLIGCVEFQGWAETNIELAFDERTRALVGNAKVLNVNLSGTGGVGGGFIARMVQNSIDRKVNPIEIISLDRLSFTFPVQKSGSLKMDARSIRHSVGDRALDVFINYSFGKG